MNSTHFMYGLLNTYKRFENTATIQAQILEGQTQSDLEEMGAIEKEKSKRIIDFAYSQNTSRNWSYLSLTVNNITPIIPLVSGYILSKDQETSIPGYLLFGTSVANIANRVFGIYEKIATLVSPSKDMQETIASRLEHGMQYLSCVAGLAGGYLATGTSTVFDSLTSWANPAVNAATQGINFGQSLNEKKTAHIRADIQTAESKIQQIFQGLHQNTKESERLTHTISDICEALKSAIHSLYSRV